MSEKFTKTLLPLTPKQTLKACRLYRSDFNDMTMQEQQIMFEACQAWQQAIQEAAE